MIKQIDDITFSFSIKTYPPIYRYGDMPSLDACGATSHLTSTYKCLDQEAINWINENNITYRISKKSNNELLLTIENEIDNMAFKLRWL